MNVSRSECSQPPQSPASLAQLEAVPALTSQQCMHHAAIPPADTASVQASEICMLLIVSLHFIGLAWPIMHMIRIKLLITIE